MRFFLSGKYIIKCHFFDDDDDDDDDDDGDDDDVDDVDDVDDDLFQVHIRSRLLTTTSIHWMFWVTAMHSASLMLAMP